MTGAGLLLVVALLAGPPARTPSAGRPEARETPPPARVMARPTPRYTGEVISLNVKDADLRDVILHLAELSGLSVALDAGVRGTLTLRLDDVPCDQALDLVVRLNGLGSMREGRALLVAPAETLLARARGR